MEPLQVALIQSNLLWEDPEANLAKLTALIAAAPAADMVVLPEMFSTGFTMDPQNHCEEMDGNSVFWMIEMAENLECAITGSLIIHEDGKYYNRMIFVTPDGVQTHYDKRHLFRMAGEHEVYTGGNQQVVVEYLGWKICLQVCYDLRFPVFSRKKSEQGYDILLYSANWPQARSSHWKALLLARAIENQAYCLGVNRVGTDGKDISYSGDSAIISPRGEFLVTASQVETVLSASLDWNELESYRKAFPAWQDADAFSLK
ncbi:MAG: amidohydrolase [Bacteroidia bacterium]|nr:amidohydrolase [Bacteroidia bacterium]